MKSNENNFKILYLFIAPDINGGGLTHLLEVLNFDFNFDLLYLSFNSNYTTAGTIYPAETFLHQDFQVVPSLEALRDKGHKIIKIKINLIGKLFLLPGIILSFYLKICRLKKKLLAEKADGDQTESGRKNIFYYLLEKPLVSLHNRLLPVVLSKSISNPEKYDIIHIFSVNIYFSLANRLARKIGKKIIITPIWHIGEYKKECIEKFLPYYEAITACTKSEKDFFINLDIKENKIKIIPPPVRAPATKTKIDFKAENKIEGRIVLFIGNQIANKGVNLILQATKDIWLKFPDTFFVFIGPKSDENLFKGIKENRIINLGFVDEEIKNAALAACDIFCLPSRYESFGLVYAEAFYFKKPVIALNTPVSREVIEKFGAGLLVTNAGELAEKIAFFFNHPDKAEVMGINGYNTLKNYDPNRIKSKLGALYEEIIKK